MCHAIFIDARMVKEFRKIIFSRAEVESALSLYVRQSLVEDAIHSTKVMEFGKDNKYFVKIVVLMENTEEKYITLSPEQVGVALMLFCRQHSIMLPRRARKSIHPENGGIALVCSLQNSDHVIL